MFIRSFTLLFVRILALNDNLVGRDKDAPSIYEKPERVSNGLFKKQNIARSMEKVLRDYEISAMFDTNNRLKIGIFIDIK